MVRGEALFDKHYHKALVSNRVYAEHDIDGAFECEKMCLDHGANCVAANVYYHSARRYSCELINELATNYHSDLLCKNKYGKFLRKQGKCLYWCILSLRRSFPQSMMVPATNDFCWTKILTKLSRLK